MLTEWPSRNYYKVTWKPDDIIEIILDETDRGLILNSSEFSKRRSFLPRLSTIFPSPKPQSVHIGIEGNYKVNQPGLRDSVSIVCYDFLEQVNDLLNDEALFGNIANFEGTIDTADPFSNKRVPDGGLIDEVNDGKWFQETLKQCDMAANGEAYMLLPVIGYVDKTGTDVNQRNKLEPFSFTLSILNRKCRYTSAAWRLLGFVPDMENKSSANITRSRYGDIGKGRTSRNYHKCLSIILKSLLNNQGLRRPIYGCIRIGDKVAQRRFFFPLAFIIGDALSGDQLCGRYKTYGPNAARLLRCCDVPFDQADNLLWQCQYLEMTKVHEMCQKAMISYGLLPSNNHLTTHQREEQIAQCADIMADLKNLSTHMHSSAFSQIWFGENPHGIYGATPTDLMHAFLQGIIPYSLRIMMSSLTIKEKESLDFLCDRCFVTIRSSEKQNYPRCNFSGGITNLTLLTATEWAGALFTMALLMRTEEVLQLFKKVCKRNLKAAKNMRKAKSHNDKDDYSEDSIPIAATDVDDGSLGNVEETEDEEEVDEDDGEDYDEDFLVEEDLQDEFAQFDVNNQLYILEMILSFHAWYKCGSPYSVGRDEDVLVVDRAIRSMLASIKKYIPRTDSNKWKLQKFHDILHVSRNMQMFGCPQNWDASPGEHNLIEFAKRPARRTQKRQSCFMEQVAQRLHEASCINKARNSIMSFEPLKSVYVANDPSDVGNNIESELIGNHFATIWADNNYTVEYRKRRCKGSAKTELHPLVIHWFERELSNPVSDLYGKSVIRIYCEYKRDKITF